MKKYITSMIFTMTLAIVPATIFAATPVTLEGNFQGAACILYNKTCPTQMTDGHIALERDFVFVLDNGQYIFVPNLDRGLKVKYLQAKVQLEGVKTGDAIRAEVVKIDKEGEYKKVWSLAEEQAAREIMERK